MICVAGNGIHLPKICTVGDDLGETEENELKDSMRVGVEVTKELGDGRCHSSEVG